MSQSRLTDTRFVATTAPTAHRRGVFSQGRQRSSGGSLLTAYPDRPDVCKAIDEARAMLEVDLCGVKVWEGGLYQRGDLRPLLGRIQCPTLVVCGALDLIGGPAQSNQIAPRVADAELLILPECGHMPALERPQPYRDAVLNWCRAHPARP